MNPLRKVSSGEPLTIDARTWNAFVDKARELAGLGSGAKDAGPTPHLTTDVYNISGVNLDRGEWSKIGFTIGNVIPVNPDDLPYEAQNNGIIRGEAGSPQPGDLLACCAEPIPNGSTGRAILAGAVVFDLEVLDPAHRYAEISPTHRDRLRSAPGGPVAIVWKDGFSGIVTALGLLNPNMPIADEFQDPFDAYRYSTGMVNDQDQAWGGVKKFRTGWDVQAAGETTGTDYAQLRARASSYHSLDISGDARNDSTEAIGGVSLYSFADAGHAGFSAYIGASDAPTYGVGGAVTSSNSYFTIRRSGTQYPGVDYSGTIGGVTLTFRGGILTAATGGTSPPPPPNPSSLIYLDWDDTYTDGVDDTTATIHVYNATVGATWYVRIWMDPVTQSASAPTGSETMIEFSGTVATADFDVTPIDLTPLNPGFLIAQVMQVTAAGGTTWRGGASILYPNPGPPPSPPVPPPPSPPPPPAPTGAVFFHLDDYYEDSTDSAVYLQLTTSTRGSTYTVTISSSGGGTDVVVTGLIGSFTTNVGPIDLTPLNAGTLTASYVLTNAGGSSTPTTDTATLHAAGSGTTYDVTEYPSVLAWTGPGVWEEATFNGVLTDLGGGAWSYENDDGLWNATGWGGTGTKTFSLTTSYDPIAPSNVDVVEQ